MKHINLLVILAILVFWVVDTQNADAQPLNLNGFKEWIQRQRPPEPTFKPKLPKYPEWYGSCPGTADLLSRFAREFKKECVDETYNSTIKSLGESLKAVGVYPQKVQKVIHQCVDNVENVKIIPLEVAKSLNECNKAVKDIKEKAKGLHKQITTSSKISSLKELDSFAGISEKIATTALTCTFKAMLTSGDMSERQRQDVKKNVDRLLSVKGKIVDLGTVAVNLAENGLEFVNSENITDIESVFTAYDKISFSDILKEKGNQFLEATEGEEERRIRKLKEKGMEIAHLMNSCQVDLAFEDLEIYDNMVDQEFLEQRWAISKAEKGMLCSAYAGNRKYERMTRDQQIWFTQRLDNNTEPNPYGLKPFDWPSHNPPRSIWYRALDKHQIFINEMESVYSEFSPDKVASARKKEKSERALIKRLIEKTNSLVSGQCVVKDEGSYLEELEMTQKRIKRARNSNCGKLGLADEFQLEKLIQILDALKAITKLQTKTRKDTTDRIKELLTFCKPSEAFRVLENAQEKMAKEKLFRDKIAIELAILKGRPQTDHRIKSPQQREEKGSSVGASNTVLHAQNNVPALSEWEWNMLSIKALEHLSAGDLEKLLIDDIKAVEKKIDAKLNIDSYDKCHSDIPPIFEKQIKDDEKWLESFLKRIDADIQPIRKAIHDCNGMSVAPNLQNIKKQLTQMRCDSAPGISVRLRDVDLLEKVIGPSAVPSTTAIEPGKWYSLYDSMGTDQASHCLTADEKAAYDAKKDVSTSAGSGTCTKCPKGFDRAVYNGSEACIKCPEGKHFSNGCCR